MPPTGFQGPTGYKGEQGEVGKDGEKVNAGPGGGGREGRALGLGGRLGPYGWWVRECGLHLGCAVHAGQSQVIWGRVCPPAWSHVKFPELRRPRPHGWRSVSWRPPTRPLWPLPVEGGFR